MSLTDTSLGPPATPNNDLHIRSWTEGDFWHALLANSSVARKQGRFRAYQVPCHVKRLREDPSWRLLDQFCELLVTNLGLAVGAHVLPMRLELLGGLGPCLVSPFVGDAGLGALPKDEATWMALGFLAVFEEWVMNADDKPEHFRVIADNPGTPCLFLLDHGHTLHSWQGDLRTPEQAASNPRVLQPSSGYKPYMVQHFVAIQGHVRRLARISDAQIDGIVSHTLDTYDAVMQEAPEVEPLVAERERHHGIVKSILTVRRDHLEQILRAKYP